ncbi:MAG: hypothetical protein ACOYU7_10060 [Bacillota bacterium]
MEKVLQQILDKLSGIDERLDRLEQGQTRLEGDVETLRLSLTRFENNAYDKFGALFDADKARQETLEEIKKQLAAHDARLDAHGGELARLRVKR